MVYSAPRAKSGARVIIITNEWDVAIGGSHAEVMAGSGYRYWYGLIDDVRIYDEVLSENEIYMIYYGWWWPPYYVLADADGPYEIAPGGTVVLDGSGTEYYPEDGTLWMDWFIGGEHVGAGETLSLSYDTLINDFGLGLGVYDVLLQVEIEYDYEYGYSEAWTTMEIVPEPATIALFGLGGLALLRRRR